MTFTFKFLVKLACGLFVLVFYSEYLIYFVVQHKCHWPQLHPENEDKSIEPSNEKPVKIMVLADIHLLGPKNGHWFDKLRREWQMFRSFQASMVIHKPELVFVLGDLTDEGLWTSAEEFDMYVARFYHLFAVPEGTRLYVAVGNHDIGFHYHVSPYLNQRFVKAFNAPPVQLISLRGNHFVILNSMALEGDGCFLCKPAEQQLVKIERILKCAQGLITEKCSSKLKIDRYSRPILMQHYPLYRQSDLECKDFDAAPFPIKKERFRETWECISRNATMQILNQVQPRLSMSGHTHHGCTRPLPVGDGIELTISSFSWRNKENPNYLLAVFSPNNYNYVKCRMPKETEIIVAYWFAITAFITFILYVIVCKQRHKFKYR